VIALAIAIATQGTGASLISGLTTNATMGAMASAGFTSMVSQASISLINNQGDLGKTFKELGSSQSIRSLTTSVLSAGVTQGLSDHLNLPTRATTFSEHLQKSVVTSGTSAALSMLVHKQDAKDALFQAAKGIAADTIGGVIANNIGEAYSQQDLNWVMHKLAHGALGAFTGVILGDDPAAGALAGALGGVVSEIIAEAMLPEATERAMEQALEKAASEGRPLTYQDIEAALSTEIHKVANMGRLGTAFAAFGFEQDVNRATRAATIAVENNFVPLVLVGLSIASAVYSAYEVYSAYDKAGGGEKGAKAALKELGIQVAINVAGGAVGKLGTKAASAILTKILAENPIMAMVFQKAAAQLGKVETAIANTKAGQAAAKIEEAVQKTAGKGVHNANTKKALDYGNKKHKEFTEETRHLRVEKKIVEEETGRLLRPDLPTEKMVHELKPGTVTGVKKGLKQLKNYQDVSKKPGMLHLYAPEGKIIDIDTIVQKNFPEDPVVQKILEDLGK
jgi:hypothetical protein